MVSVEKIETLQGFDDLRGVWDRLLAKNDFRNIFLTFDWLRTWWKVFGGDKELYVLIVKSDAEIIGIAPLMLETSRRLGRTVKVIRFIGTPNVDYGDFIGENKKLIIEHIVRYLILNGEDWFRVELDQVSERSSSLAHGRAVLESRDFLSAIRKTETCYCYAYDNNDGNRVNFDIRKGQTIRRSINHFKKARGLTLERIFDMSSAKRSLAMLFQFHINRWDDTATPSKFLNQANRQFYKKLVELLLPQKKICILSLKSGSMPLAYSFYYEFEGTIYHYTLAYNEYFGRRSPGNLLLILGSESLVREGFDLDYSRGTADYKELRANRSYDNYRITLYSGRSDYFSAKIAEYIKKSRPVRAILGKRRVQYYRLKLADVYHRNGLRGLIFKIIGFLFKSILDYKVVYLFRHDGRQETIPTPKIEVEIKMLGIENADQIATFYGVREGSDKHKTIIRRFENKADCFAVLHNGNIVYVSWTLFGEDFWSDYNLSVKPESDELVFCDALASPIYRGIGLYTYMLAYKLNKYSRERYRALSAIARSNTPALKATAKFAFKRLRTYRRLKLFSRWVI